jgi:hypothetical protein
MQKLTAESLRVLIKEEVAKLNSSKSKSRRFVSESASFSFPLGQKIQDALMTGDLGTIGKAFYDEFGEDGYLYFEENRSAIKQVLVSAGLNLVSLRDVDDAIRDYFYNLSTEMRKKEFSQSSDKKELSAIAVAIGTAGGIIAPSELKSLTYYTKRGKNAWSIQLQDIDSRLGHMTAVLTQRHADRTGTDFEKIVNVLDKYGASKGKRLNPKRPTGYDGWSY